MHFKNNNLRLIALSIVLLSFMTLSTINQSNVSLDSLQSKDNQYNQNILFSSDPIDYLQEYNGSGNDLQVVINGTGSGNSTSNPNLKDGWINLYPPPTNNQSSFSITTPAAQKFENIMLNASDIQKAQFQEIILNDTAIYYPNYTISYTNNSKLSLAEPSFINITANQSNEMPLGDINIYVNDELNHTAGQYQGSGNHSHQILFTEEGNWTITVEFKFLNGSNFRNETFLVYHSDDENSILIINSPESQRKLDFLKLNNYDTINPNRSPNQAALKFQITGDTFLYKFSVFAMWNMPTVVSLNITNALGTGQTYGIAYYNITGTESGKWIDFIFNDLVNLSIGEYWGIINVKPLIDVFYDMYHFSLNFINSTEGKNQESKYYNRSTGTWQNFGYNFLAKYVNYSWLDSNLTEVSINATVPLLNSTQSFSYTSNTTHFNQAIETTVPINSILINFQSNWTIRFKLDYSLDISANNTFITTDFFYSNGSQYVIWNASYTLVPLNDVFDRTHFSIQNYTFIGFTSFVSMNATNGTLNITDSSNRLIINDTTGAFSSEWQIYGYSNPVNCTIENADGTSKIQRGFNLIIKANYITNQYRTNMSLWGNETFLNSSYKTRTLINQSDSVEFDPILISGTLPYEKLLVRVDWNNGTEVGITYREFYVEDGKIFLIKSMIEIKSYREFYVEDGSQISVLTNEVQIISEQNGTFVINYSDYQNITIPDAIVQTNWSAANWSYTFTVGTGYRFEITTDSISLGTAGFIQINFTHNNYRDQTVILKIIHVVSTELTINDLDSMIYLGNSFFADLAYYSAKGEPTSLHSVTISLIINGNNCGFNIIRVNSTNPNSNLFLRANQTHSNFPNSSGNYSYTIQLSLRIGDLIYENKTITGVLEIKRIPSLLTFISTTAYSFNQTLKEIIEYEKYNESLVISAKLIANETSVRGLGEMKPNSNISVWIELTESNLKQVSQMEYKADGIYTFSFSTFDTPTGTIIGIKIFVNHSYYEQKELTYTLKIIDKMNIAISLNNIQNIKEGTVINITGSVSLDNKSIILPLKNTNISVDIVFSSATQNQTKRYIVTTDDEGNFAIYNITVPFQKDFQTIVVIINVNETREYYGLSQRTSAAIIEYLFGYITSRVAIALVIILFAAIISVKHIAPSIKSVLIEKKLLKKIQRTAEAQFSSFVQKDGYYLRVAKNEIEDPLLVLADQQPASDSTMELLKIEEFHQEEAKNSKAILRNIIVGFLETLGAGQQQKPEKIKERALLTAAKLQSRGKYQEAILAYKTALKTAKTLNLQEETRAIENYIKMCEKLAKSSK